MRNSLLSLIIIFVSFIGCNSNTNAAKQEKDKEDTTMKASADEYIPADLYETNGGTLKH